jgi:protein-disulfide isomerase
MTRQLTVPLGPRDHVMGSRNARIVLVEYGDYQCPACGRAYPIVQQLQHAFGDSLAFAFRNFPLPDLHPDALRAAETAEWAGLSRRFWPMHDFLFEHQDQLDASRLLAAAARLDLDRHQLQVAWRDGALHTRIREDVASGAASGVTGTPTFFINGERYDDSWDFDDLAAAIADAGASWSR